MKAFANLVSLTISPESVFRFPQGVPAFEECREFVFLHNPDTSPFMFMRALGGRDLSFVCIDPFLVCSGYKPKISESDVKFLGLQDPGDAMLLSVVTLAPDMRDMTANLEGPIVVNVKTLIGKQILCEGDEYPIRYKLWDALSLLKAEEKKKIGRGKHEHLKPA